ncbi:MAG: hypothetical protein QNL88_06420 [Acidobacteriota bacterium]|nr:hypothetical protein [Acidobacteriota bacterium]
MRATRFEMASDFQVSAADLWSFHMHDDALDVLAPPFSGFAVRDRGEGVSNGSVVEFALGAWPLRKRWVALHCNVEPERSFTDIALDAPFPYWVHRHDMKSLAPESSRLVDTVWFRAPGGFPRWIADPAVRVVLRLMFSWRHWATRRWLAKNVSKSPRHELNGSAMATGGSS